MGLLHCHLARAAFFIADDVETWAQADALDAVGGGNGLSADGVDAYATGESTGDDGTDGIGLLLGCDEGEADGVGRDLTLGADVCPDGYGVVDGCGVDRLVILGEGLCSVGGEPDMSAVGIRRDDY